VHLHCVSSLCLQKHGVRIIVGNFYENKAALIFCEAYKQKMYGAQYAWIITGTHVDIYKYLLPVIDVYGYSYWTGLTLLNGFHF